MGADRIGGRLAAEPVAPALALSMRNRVQMRAVQRAADIAGGGAALARYLQVPPLLVAAWIAGAAEMPLEAFMKVVDIVVDDPANRAGSAIAALRAQDLKYTEAANS